MSPTLNLTRQHIGQAQYWHEEAIWRDDEGKNASGDILNVCEYLIKTVETQQTTIERLESRIAHLEASK